MPVFPLVAAGAALSLAVASAILDHRTGRIPNALVLPGIVLGIALGALAGGAGGALEALFGALIAGAVPALLNRAGAMGGGDLKLFAALGALTGPRLGLEIQTAAFLCGAVQGLALWWRSGCLAGGLAAAASLVIPFAGRRIRERSTVRAAAKTTLRFGPAIAVGAALALGLSVLG
jgi:prepilin peptidase CpaA